MELVHAIREYRTNADSKPLPLQGSDYAHDVQELNKAIGQADGLLLGWWGECVRLSTLGESPH